MVQQIIWSFRIFCICSALALFYCSLDWTFLNLRFSFCKESSNSDESNFDLLHLRSFVSCVCVLTCRASWFQLLATSLRCQIINRLVLHKNAYPSQSNGRNIRFSCILVIHKIFYLWCCRISEIFSIDDEIYNLHFRIYLASVMRSCHTSGGIDRRTLEDEIEGRNTRDRLIAGREG